MIITAAQVAPPLKILAQIIPSQAYPKELQVITLAIRHVLRAIQSTNRGLATQTNAKRTAVVSTLIVATQFQNPQKKAVARLRAKHLAARDYENQTQRVMNRVRFVNNGNAVQIVNLKTVNVFRSLALRLLVQRLHQSLQTLIIYPLAPLPTPIVPKRVFIPTGHVMIPIVKEATNARNAPL